MKVSEHQEQCVVVQWASLQSKNLPALRTLVAIPNGGYRHIAVARKLKAEGVRAGFPDLLLPEPIAPFHGLFIEMKVEKNRPSTDQKWWLTRLSKNGYCAAVCYGADAAIWVLDRYCRGLLAEYQYSVFTIRDLEASELVQ